MTRRRWHVELLPSARRELIALRGPIQDRVRAAIRSLADDQLHQLPSQCEAKALDFIGCVWERIVLSTASTRRECAFL